MYRDIGLDGFSDAVAIHFLVDQGVRIINMSWGGGSLSSPERDALNYASDAGVLLIAAIGNNGSARRSGRRGRFRPPAAYRGRTLVGASTDTGTRVNFSNYGQNLSLMAPGAFADNDCADGIYLPLPPVAYLFDGNQCIRFFTDPQTNARYGYLRGTSFAAPEVAGAAALLWAARPSLKSFEVATLLQHGSTQTDGTGWDQNDGWGVLTSPAPSNSRRDNRRPTGLSSARRPVRRVGRAGQHMTETGGAELGRRVPRSPAAVVCAGTVGGKPVSAARSGVHGRTGDVHVADAGDGGRSLSGTIAAAEPQTGLFATQPFTSRSSTSRARRHTVCQPGRGARVPLALRGERRNRSGVAVGSSVYRRKVVAIFSATRARPDPLDGARAPDRRTAFHFCVTATDKAGNVERVELRPYSR